MTTTPKSIALACNMNALGLHDGLPYAHLSASALAYYVAEGLIVERPQPGRFDITQRGRDLIAEVRRSNQP